MPAPGFIREAAVAGVSPARLKRFFVSGDHGYQIQKFIRDLCVFARHDLAKDPPFSRLDLISCRNVLIYMGPALQKRVLSMFQYALKPGGFLFLGNSESISEYSDAFTAEDRKHRNLRAQAVAACFSRVRAGGGSFREPGRATAEYLAPSAAIDFRKEAEALLLEHYTPPALIVDPDLHIVHFQGDTSPYLAPATGQPSFHLLKMVRPELVVDLRAAIYKGPGREGVASTKTACSSSIGASPPRCGWKCGRSEGATAKKQDLLVVFQESRSGHGEPRRRKSAAGKTYSAEKRRSWNGNSHPRGSTAHPDCANTKPRRRK